MPLLRSKLSILSLGAVCVLQFQAQAQEGSKTVETRFLLSPPNARVYLKTQGSESPLSLEQGKALVTFPSEYIRGGKEIEFRFSVPGWFGREYPNWSQLSGEERGELSNAGFGLSADYEALRKSRKIPLEQSSYRLPLPFTVAFQAYTLAYPVLSLLLTLGFVFAAVAATRWKEILRRIVPQPETVDPTRVGDYRLKTKVGEGGMGEVWSASSIDGMPCALKFIHKELNDNPESRDRLDREIRACLPLRHRHLLRLYGHGVASDGRLFTVSELLVGRTLKEVIQSREFDPPQLATKVIEEIGDVLFYLHQRRLFHRDIKPDNIFVCDSGDLKLMDMGLIKGSDYTVLTQTGAMMGTPAYMSAEQALGGEITGASDQYSLGIILYEILTGQRPFSHSEVHTLVYHHAYVAPESPSVKQPRITPEVEAALMKMLAKEPQERFRDLKSAQKALGPLAFMTWI